MDFSQAIQLNTRKYGYVTDTTMVPPELRDFLDSEGITNLIMQICAKYGLAMNVQYDIIQLVVWYVSKQIPEQEFVNLLSLTPLQTKFFPLFLQELQDKLWDPYDTALNQAKIPYKLLTKLNPEPPEKIQEWLDSLARQYPKQPDEDEDIDALLAQESGQPQQEFSLGDQIKIFANQTAAQSLAQPQEIKIAVPETSFTPVGQQTVKPIEITVAQPQTAEPAQQTKPVEQPASQVRLEISSSPNAPRVLEQTHPEEKPTERPATFSLPSIRFQPLLEKQEGVMPKQAIPSAVLQEAMGMASANKQEPATEQAQQPMRPQQPSPVQPEQQKTAQTQQSSGSVIDLTNWNITR